MKYLSQVIVVLSTFALSACVQYAPPQPRKPVPSAPKAMPAPQAKLAPVAPIPQNVPLIKIGLLLPLSGENAELGTSMLDAAQLALYDAYVSLPPSKIKAKLVLVPKDTGTSPTVAAEVAKSALEQGVELIVGPLYSQSVTEVAPLARAKSVPVIALSNNRNVAGNGVYVFGYLPEEQVKRVAAYAIGKNILTYGALSPNDPYGATVAESLQNAITQKGGEITVSERYAKSPANVLAAAERVSQQYATTPFKALFLGEGSDQSMKLIAALQKKGLERSSYQLIGTGLWDEEEVSAIPELQGGWFATGSAETFDKFSSRYAAAYGTKPKRLASLTYDLVAMLAALAQEKGGANFSDAVLTNPAGFQGPANGAFRIRPDGVTERGLAVMEITPHGFKVLEPAPRILTK